MHPPAQHFMKKQFALHTIHILTLPAVMSCILETSETIVLFPDPLEPTNATVCPDLTVKSNPCNTSTSGRDG